MQARRSPGFARRMAMVPCALVLAACAVGLSAASARADTAAELVVQATAMPHAPALGPAAFGAPPAGEIPILYNDRTVYAKPDLLKQSRVLAALVRGGHLYVPLRSMFEQMGATVSASGDGRTITAVKPGSSVSVTLDTPEVVINGETRPLDVAPMLYHGIVLVPVRVISEAMGAYVLWVHDKRLVVVRYVPVTPPPPPPATAPPTAAPTLPPAPTPSPTPTTAPTPGSYTAFVQAAFAAPKTYNEFSAGEYCMRSYIVAGAWAPRSSAFAVKFDYRRDYYVTSDNLTDAIGNHYTQYAAIDGGGAQTPVFLAQQSSFDGRLEYQIAAPRIYIGVGYLSNGTNYGYPTLTGIGAGIEKLPDLRSGLSLFGSAFYYPSASGSYTVRNPTSTHNGNVYRQQYGILKYDVGLALASAKFPLYLYGGYNGERYNAQQNAPIGQIHDGPYLGLGLKF